MQCHPTWQSVISDWNLRTLLIVLRPQKEAGGRRQAQRWGSPWGLHEPAAVVSVLFPTGPSSRETNISGEGGETLLFSLPAVCAGTGTDPGLPTSAARLWPDGGL